MEQTLELAIQGALAYAHKKNAEHKLIRADDEEFDWENSNNWAHGDPETIYSIASLYTDTIGDKYGETILNALIDAFPSFQ